MSVNHSARSGGIIWLFFDYLQHEGMLCVLIEAILMYTQHTSINIKKKIAILPNNIINAAMGVFSKGLKNEFERAISVPATYVLL